MHLRRYRTGICIGKWHGHAHALGVLNINLIRNLALSMSDFNLISCKQKLVFLHCLLSLIFIYLWKLFPCYPSVLSRAQSVCILHCTAVIDLLGVDYCLACYLIIFYCHVKCMFIKENNGGAKLCFEKRPHVTSAEWLMSTWWCCRFEPEARVAATL